MLDDTADVSGEHNAQAILPRRLALEALPLAARHLCVAEYHECRLEAHMEQVDYLCVLRREGARALLESGIVDSARDLAPLRELLTSWLDDESLLASRVPFVWLEFDDIQSTLRRTEPLPSVSVCLVPNYRAERPLPGGVRSRHLETAANVLQLLRLHGASHDERALDECFAKLPEGARWIHLSVMLGRSPRAVKLYGVIPRAEFLSYLEEIGWRGDLAAIAALLQGPYARELVGDELYVDLNLENFRDPTRASLGLAVSQQHAVRGPDRDPSRTKVLSRWSADGLVSSEKAEACRRWLDTKERFLDLKLVWQGTVSPKAYLGEFRLPS